MRIEGARVLSFAELCEPVKNYSENKPLRLNIDYYQRPFKWDKERTQKLFSDFFRNADNSPSDENYFAGSVVLAKTKKERNSIIDGQQRITTLYLLNFLLFLLRREELSCHLLNRNLAGAVTAVNDLVEPYTLVFGCDKEKNPMQELKSTLSRLSSRNEKISEDVVAQFKKVTGLPSQGHPTDEDYVCSMSVFLSEDKALTYSMASYNDHLKDALSRLRIFGGQNDPALKAIQSNSDIAEQYLSCARHIFEAVKNRTSSKFDDLEPFSKTLADCMSQVINKIQLCAIVAKEESDAYTLFEVLNDRAMEIDDLDLIKNLLMRKYCLTAKAEDGAESDTNMIESTIKTVDEAWNEEIFNVGQSQTKTRMISYFVVDYLTGTGELDANDGKFRSALKDNFLEKFDNTNKFLSGQLLKTLEIYQQVATLVKRWNLADYDRPGVALGAEIENTSITYKTFHFLNALKQPGVNAAMVDVIIASYAHEKSQAISFEQYIENLKTDSESNAQSFSQIHKIALILWRASMRSSGYENPLKIAKRIRKAFNFSAFAEGDVFQTEDEGKELDSQFEEWLAGWKKGKESGASDLKAKILFSIVLRSRIERHEEKTSLYLYQQAQINLGPNKLVLDHMEAKTPESSHMEEFFQPEDPDMTREEYVEGLGNFILLGCTENGKKSNRPLYSSFDEYKELYQSDVCPFLIDEARSLLDKKENHKDVIIEIPNSDKKTVQVPSEGFFKERTLTLRKYFKAILSRNDIGTTIVEA